MRLFFSVSPEPKLSSSAGLEREKKNTHTHCETGATLGWKAEKTQSFSCCKVSIFAHQYKYSRWMQTGVPICSTKSFVVSLLDFLLIQIGLLQLPVPCCLCGMIILGFVAFPASRPFNYLLHCVFPEGRYSGNILQMKKQLL